MRGATSEGRRGRLFAIESLAGWVFADMLLVLFIVGIASAVPLPEPDPEPTATPTPTPTPTPASPSPSPSPTPEPQIVGMRTDPEEFTISFNAGALLGSSESEAESVCAFIAEESDANDELDEQRAAFVLIFGGASDATTGQEIARRVAEQLQCADDDLYQADSAVRPYWSGSTPYGQADLEVFTFTTDLSETEQE